MKSTLGAGSFIRHKSTMLTRLHKYAQPLAFHPSRFSSPFRNEMVEIAFHGYGLKRSTVDLMSFRRSAMQPYSLRAWNPWDLSLPTPAWTRACGKSWWNRAGSNRLQLKVPYRL